ncbi:hypothetical protein EDB87DRAFT_1822589 [Lactarius vividus]|nr:hypothetical protein EDB87DRAFT_1822589 [Lactarius vividus]
MCAVVPVYLFIPREATYQGCGIDLGPRLWSGESGFAVLWMYCMRVGIFLFGHAGVFASHEWGYMVRAWKIASYPEIQTGVSPTQSSGQARHDVCEDKIIGDLAPVGTCVPTHPTSLSLHLGNRVFENLAGYSLSGWCLGGTNLTRNVGFEGTLQGPGPSIHGGSVSGVETPSKDEFDLTPFRSQY